MKAKHPETVWVVFKKGEPKIPLDSASYKFRFCDKKVHCQKPYHLHPGNEVKKVRGELARAQIVKDLNYLYECPSPMGTALVAKRFGVGFKGMRFV